MRRIIVLICVFLWVGSLNGQGTTVSVRKIGLQDGLSSYKYNMIYQDKQGVVWVATEGGLNALDGNKIKSYTAESHVDYPVTRLG